MAEEATPTDVRTVSKEQAIDFVTSKYSVKLGDEE